MSAPSVAMGCVFHWEEYAFDDGVKANKYLVLVGTRSSSNYLAVIATSKPHRRSYTAGCHANEGYYHIPAGRDGFPKDTWLLIAEPKEIISADFLARAMKKQIELKFQLRHDVANGICNCMRQCRDVSDDHKALLGPPAQPAKKV
jgi:hypothetical protein